ncbi:DUF4230 domain-containing protein [Candidatus Chlorohelix sp.]|uniref:DUF4230 domain-containing protein n=1 Tax=Candidatus Chlorohelix sp. TaxID=3139201 RepID=UPI003024D67C
MGKSSGSFFAKLLVVLVIATVGIVGYLYSNSFVSKSVVNTPNPILVGNITREYKLITAQVTGSTTVEGESKSWVPFSTEKWSYQMVMTVTAGIDMTKLLDTDIRTDMENLTVTIRLPVPEVLTKEKGGWVVSKDSQIASGFSSDKNIVDKMQATGEQKILDGILKEGKLFREARLNAEIQLRNLILQLGYRQVKFEYADQPTVIPITPTSSLTAPPR